MNLSQATMARSDQLNADDLISGPRTFTVKEVRRGDAEQPVAIVLAEFPDNRPFKPSKTVTRLLAYAWGEETDDWPESPRLTLYRDAKVKWAGQEIGGIRVSHLSHIEKHPDLKGGQLKVALAESKGKKSLHTVTVLPAGAPTTAPVSEEEVARAAEKRAEPTAEEVAACADRDELKAMWKRSGPERKAQIEQRVVDLDNEPAAIAQDADA